MASRPRPSSAYAKPSIFSLADNRESLELEKSTLKLEFEQTRAKLSIYPEQHPDYNEEWQEFWVHKSRNVRERGLDHLSYDYIPEWQELWSVRMEELLRQEYNSKLDDLERKYEKVPEFQPKFNSLLCPPPAQEYPFRPCVSGLQFSDVRVEEAVKRPSPAVQTPTVVSIPPVENKCPDLLQVLGQLVRMKDHLDGPLSAKVLQFFRMAEDMESSMPGSSKLFLKSRDLVDLLNGCKNRFLEKMQTDIISPDVLSLINVNIYNVNKILQMGQPIKSESRNAFQTSPPSTLSQAPDSQTAWANSFDRRRPIQDDEYRGEIAIQTQPNKTERGSRFTNSDFTMPLTHEPQTTTPQRFQNSTNSLMSDKAWSEFFVGTGSNLPSADPGLMAFLYNQSPPENNAAKSCLRVPPTERKSEAIVRDDSNHLRRKGSRFSPNIDSDLQNPAVKKSCLRQTSSSFSLPQDPPELVKRTKPGYPSPSTSSLHVETWRKVIVDSKPTRTTSTSKEISRTAPLPKPTSKPKPLFPNPLALTVPKNMKMDRRAQQFSSESDEESQPCDTVNAHSALKEVAKSFLTFQHPNSTNWSKQLNPTSSATATTQSSTAVRPTLTSTSVSSSTAAVPPLVWGQRMGCVAPKPLPDSNIIPIPTPPCSHCKSPYHKSEACNKKRKDSPQSKNSTKSPNKKQHSRPIPYVTPRTNSHCIIPSEVPLPPGESKTSKWVKTWENNKFQPKKIAATTRPSAPAVVDIFSEPSEDSPSKNIPTRITSSNSNKAPDKLITQMVPGIAAKEVEPIPKILTASGPRINPSIALPTYHQNQAVPKPFNPIPANLAKKFLPTNIQNFVSTRQPPMVHPMNPMPQAVPPQWPFQPTQPQQFHPPINPYIFQIPVVPFQSPVKSPVVSIVAMAKPILYSGISKPTESGNISKNINSCSVLKPIAPAVPTIPKVTVSPTSTTTTGISSTISKSTLIPVARTTVATPTVSNLSAAANPTSSTPAVSSSTLVSNSTSPDVTKSTASQAAAKTVTSGSKPSATPIDSKLTTSASVLSSPAPKSTSTNANASVTSAISKADGNICSISSNQNMTSLPTRNTDVSQSLKTSASKSISAKPNQPTTHDTRKLNEPVSVKITPSNLAKQNAVQTAKTANPNQVPSKSANVNSTSFQKQKTIPILSTPVLSSTIKPLLPTLTPVSFQPPSATRRTRGSRYGSVTVHQPPVCFICSKPGHVKKSCPEWLARNSRQIFADDMDEFPPCMYCGDTSHQSFECGYASHRRFDDEGWDNTPVPRNFSYY